jgi:hypothetical protein
MIFHAGFWLNHHKVTLDVGYAVDMHSYDRKPFDNRFWKWERNRRMIFNGNKTEKNVIEGKQDWRDR